MLLRMALRNLYGGGLRSILNVLVLSLAYIGIIGLQGIGEHLRMNMFEAAIAEEVGGGHYQHREFDPYDPFIEEESFAPMPGQFRKLVDEGKVTPMLIISGIAYPQGRMQNVTLRGIDPAQDILELPGDMLENDSDAVPVFIGRRMKRITRLSEGDTFMVRWRDEHGTFNARRMVTAGITTFADQGLDAGNIWMPLSNLQEMMRVEDAVTLLVLSPDKTLDIPVQVDSDEWVFKTQNELTGDLSELAMMMDIELYIFYVIFLSLALISVFDTQILALFRRRKEMGTLMALGMTRKQLITLFTMESALYAIFAVFAAAVYGTPLLLLFKRYGIPMPFVEDFGIPGVTDALYPYYNPNLIPVTIFIVIIVVVIVSYLPTRKIAKLKPTDALRGRWT